MARLERFLPIHQYLARHDERLRLFARLSQAALDQQTIEPLFHEVWSSYCTRSFKPRGQPCATGEVSTRLRVPIGHLGQEPVVAQCAPPLPPSTWHRSVSYAPQTGSCK